MTDFEKYLAVKSQINAGPGSHTCTFYNGKAVEIFRSAGDGSVESYSPKYGETTTKRITTLSQDGDLETFYMQTDSRGRGVTSYEKKYDYKADKDGTVHMFNNSGYEKKKWQTTQDGKTYEYEKGFFDNSLTNRGCYLKTDEKGVSTEYSDRKRNSEKYPIAKYVPESDGSIRYKTGNGAGFLEDGLDVAPCEKNDLTNKFEKVARKNNNNQNKTEVKTEQQNNAAPDEIIVNGKVYKLDTSAENSKQASENKPQKAAENNSQPAKKEEINWKPYGILHGDEN